MALTLKDQGEGNPSDGLTGLTWRAVDATFDASYAVGGLPLAPADVAMTRILMVLPTPASGYVFSYDYTNMKLQVYRVAGHQHTENTAATYTQSATTGQAGLAAMVEAAAAVNLSAVTARLLIIGVA